MSGEVDVVIVGAGAAGIAAARRLAGTGLSVSLLEASARIGGRAWTRDIAGLRLDMGCGWLHSADRNAWTAIAEADGFDVDRRPPAWGTQYRDLGFSQTDQAAAREAFAAWNRRLVTAPPASDCAADVLKSEEEWRAYLQAMSGYISGAPLEQISVIDYVAYDQASTGNNWRVREGYGTLVSHSMPRGIDLRLSTPVDAIEFIPGGVSIKTPRGVLTACAAILTMSTRVLADGLLDMPPALDPWRHAAASLPLGCDEKLFFEIVGNSPFAPETHVLGDPRDARTGVYYISPLGRPVIECFLGGDGARIVEAEGLAVCFERATDQLITLFGSGVRRNLRPLVASNWAGTSYIGGAYSYALPGRASARQKLARSFDQCVFFAGEATNASDFSTAHGAHDSGVRAAEEVLAAFDGRTR